MSENFRDPRLNSVMLTGRLTRDVEMRRIKGDVPCAEFGLAVNHAVKTGDEWSQEAYFFDVVTWRETAEHCAEKLYKGCPALVEGKLVQERWEKEGQKHSRVRINAFKVTPLEWQRSGDNPEAEEDDDEISF